jgi:PST family polysaccharide transporter
MSLVKTSLLNGIAVAIKLTSALILNKVLAIYVGPAGYAIIGQFQNAVSVLVSFAGGLLATGVTKYTAEHFDNQTKQHEIWRTAIRFSLLASVVVGLSLFFVGSHLSDWLLHRSDMTSIFIWLALALPAMAANNLLLAIVNGKKEIGIYISANIIGGIVSLLLVTFFAYFFGLYGALLAFVLSPAAVLVSTAVLVSRQKWFNSFALWGSMNVNATRKLSGFAIMGVTSAVVMPISYMLIRDHLAMRLGLSAAGFWQASWKISEIYLMLVTTTLSVYYLPRISEIKTKIELRKEITKVYRFIMPIVVIGAIAIYFLRDFIISVLFTEDFYPMRELFGWQLTGDVIKMGSWILAYIMVGRAMIRSFVTTEIIFSISFVLLSWNLIDIFGLKGVAIAYAINYIFYLVIVSYLTKLELKKM